MDALYDFADSGADASLVTQIGHVLSSLANDYTSLFGRHNGAKGQVGLRVFLLGALRSVVGGVEAAIAVGAVVVRGRHLSVFGGHVVEVGSDGKRSVVGRREGLGRVEVRGKQCGCMSVGEEVR